MALCADPEDPDSVASGSRHGDRPGGRSGRAPRPPGRHKGGGPRRVEAELSGFSVRAERYGTGGSHAWRLAVSVHDLEVRAASRHDCKPRTAAQHRVVAEGVKLPP